MTDLEQTTAPTFSDNSAQDTSLAVQETQEWIEAVTGRTFSAPFRESLENGVVLCELMRKVNPGSVRKINKSRSPIAHLDNIQQFLSACRALGLKDAQLFDTMELQAPKGSKTGVKRSEADRHIRNVCVTLYWLGKTVAGLDSYSGPQLDLEAFRQLMDGTFSPDLSDDDSSLDQGVVLVPNHLATQQSNHLRHGGEADYLQQGGEADYLQQGGEADYLQQGGEADYLQQGGEADYLQQGGEADYLQQGGEAVYLQQGGEANHLQELSVDQQSSDHQEEAVENGFGLTFEQEQTADQLLADIQNAVDEMLHDFQLGSLPPPSLPTTTNAPTSPEQSQPQESSSLGVSVHMNSRNGSFGFQVVGGVGTGIPPKVEFIVPGSPAEESGVAVGDQMVSVNKQDISGLTHLELVSIIKKAGSKGSMTVGLVRSTDPSARQGHHKPPSVAPKPARPVHYDPKPSKPVHYDPKPSKPVQYDPKPVRYDPIPADPVRYDQIPAYYDQDPEPTTEDHLDQDVIPARAFSREDSRLLWEEEHREMERQAREIAMMYPRKSLLDGILDKPLTPVMEEAIAEQMEALEFMLPQSPTPPPPHSPVVQKQYKPHRLPRSPPHTPPPSPPHTPSSSPLRTPPPSPPHTPSPSPLRSPPPSPPHTIPPSLTRTLSPSPPHTPSPSPPRSPPPSPHSPSHSLSRLPPPSPPSSSSLTLSLPPSLSPASTSPPPSPELHAAMSLMQASLERAEQQLEQLMEKQNQLELERAKGKEEPSKVKSEFEELSPMTGQPNTPIKYLESPVNRSVERTESPVKRTESPLKHTESSVKRTDSPLKRTETPVEHTETPVERIESPVERTETPVKRTETPVKRTVSPVKRTESPVKRTETPVKHAESPLKRTESPVKSPVKLSVEQVSPVEDNQGPVGHSADTQSPLPVSPKTPATFIAREVTPDLPKEVTPGYPVELDNGIKIHRVQRTRWTPQQHWTQQRSPQQEATPSPRPEAYFQRQETQPPRWEVQLEHNQKPMRRLQSEGGEASQSSDWRAGRSNTWAPRDRYLPRQQPQQPEQRIPPPQQHPKEPLHTQRDAEEDDWRGRSQTWAHERRTSDGPQPVTAMKATNVRELCCRCQKPLGTGAVMSIAPLKLQFHLHCFVCRVCRGVLSRGPQNTSVLVQNLQPHCRYCYSNNQGLMTTEC